MSDKIYEVPLDQIGTVSFQAMNSKTGKPATFDPNTPTKATSSDETVATVAVIGGDVEITPLAPGEATVTVDGDADPSAGGVTDIIDTFKVVVPGVNPDSMKFGDAVALRPKP